MSLQPYEQLRAWKAVLRLVDDVYACSESFPDSERSGITATLRRGVAAVGGKLAEAAARPDAGKAAAALDSLQASLMEIDGHLLIAHHLAYLSRWRASRLRRRLRRLQRELEVLAEQWRADAEAQDEAELDLRLAA